MIPDAAVDKAIEGGWQPREINLADMLFAGMTSDEILREAQTSIALDPSFWQCLGKTLGWPKEHYGKGEFPDNMTFGQWDNSRPSGVGTRFVNLILTGGDIESFWKELGV